MPIRLYFCRHNGAISNRGLQLFSAANTVLLENATCDDIALKEDLFNRVSQGTLTLEEGLASVHDMGEPEFLRSILAGIHKTRKTVYVEHSPLTFSELGPALSPPPRLHNDLKEALHQMETWIQSAAEVQERRDRQLVNQLVDLVAINGNNDILAILGSGHQYPLERYLDRKGVVYKSYRSGKPTFYELAASRFGTDEPPSQYDLMKVIAELHMFNGRLDLTEEDIAGIGKTIRGMSKSKLREFAARCLIR